MNVVELPRKEHLTLGSVEEIMSETDRAIIPVVGDCLEGAGVQDGGWVAVDFTRFPGPPRLKSKGGDGSVDLCLCCATYRADQAPTVMCKAYDGVWGACQVVSTRYKNTWDSGEYRMDVGLFAERIYGVIFASWDKEGKLLWERDPDSFPTTLGTTPTIHGENIGDPICKKAVRV